MAGPKPQDEYNPVPEVTPSLNVADNTLSVRAQPSQSGNALAGAGKDISQAGNEVFNTALQIQGLANEHAANAAEMQLAVQGGQLYDEYKSKTGLDAANAKDAYVKNYLALNEKIRGSLGAPQAQKAYDSLATRRMSFTIQDMNSYAADQTKKAYMTGNNAAMNLAIDETSKYEVANDPAQFGDRIGNIVFQTNAMFTAPQYGRYQDISASTNKDGTLKFDTATAEGRIAQADYDQYLQEATGRAYSNAIKTIADDPQHGDIDKAVKLLDQSKDKMPASTYAKMSTELSARYRNEQTRDVATEAINDVNRTYRQTAGITDSGSLVSVFHAQESGNGATSTNLGQIQPGTWAQYSKPGEDINNPDDNRAVTDRILTDYSHRYNGDIGKIATAFFSGPGNVSDSGPSPFISDYKDKNGKSVSSYVDDIKARTGGAGIGQNGYISQANYVRLNWSNITDQVRAKAEELHPHDATFADQSVSRVQQHMADIIRTQEQSVRADQDKVYNFAMGSNGQAPVTSLGQLENGPPEIRQAWQNFQLNNPIAAEAFSKNVISANARGASLGLGQKIYDWYDKVLSGDIKDPHELFNAVGGEKNSPLTNSGLRLLTDEMENLKTPQGLAFAQAERDFFNDAHSKITGQSQYPHIQNEKGEERYRKFLAQTVPVINSARKDNKDVGQLFDPKSADYVGKNMSGYVLDTTKLFNEVAPSISNGLYHPPVSYSSIADLRKAVDEKKMSIEDAKKYALDHKLARADEEQVPQVPKPFQGE